MDKNVRFWIGRIALIVFMAAGIGALIYVFVMDHIDGQRTNPIEQRVSRYETEISDIEDELNLMKNDILQTNTFAQVSLVFQVENDKEFDAIDKVLDGTEYVPTIMIDSAMEPKQMENLFTKIQERQWDIVLAGAKVNSGTMKKAKAAKELAQQKQVRVTNLFCMEKEKYTDSDVLILKDAGFAGFSQFTDYSNKISSGFSMNSEMIYMEYVPVNDFSKKVSGSVKLICSTNKELMFTINMKEYLEDKKGTVTQNDLKQLFELLRRRQDEGRLKVVPSYEIIDDLQNDLKVSLQKQEEYDEYSAKQKIKIEELQKKKEEVYNTNK